MSQIPLQFNVLGNNNDCHEFNVTEFLVNDHRSSYADSFSTTSENNLSTAYESAQNITSNYATVQNNEQFISSTGQYYQTPPQHVTDDSTPVCTGVPKISMTFDSFQNQIVKVEFAGVEIVIKQKSDQNQRKNCDHLSASTYSSTLSTNRNVNRMHPYRHSSDQYFRNNNRNNFASPAPAIMTPITPQLNAVYMQNNRSVITTDNSQPQFQQNEEWIEPLSSGYDNFRD